VQSAIRRDRMEVSAPQLSELRDNMLFTLRKHLPVAPEFTEFRLQRDGMGMRYSWCPGSG
jgi:septum formation topological specificity factor MinE